jgi:hypothetical protein
VGEEEVLEIRRRAREGETQTALAREYHLSLPALNAIVKRRNWRHLP